MFKKTLTATGMKKRASLRRVRQRIPGRAGCRRGSSRMDSTAWRMAGSTMLRTSGTTRRPKELDRMGVMSANRRSPASTMTVWVSEVTCTPNRREALAKISLMASRPRGVIGSSRPCTAATEENTLSGSAGKFSGKG